MMNIKGTSTMYYIQTYVRVHAKLLKLDDKRLHDNKKERD